MIHFSVNRLFNFRFKCILLTNMRYLAVPVSVKNDRKHFEEDLHKYFAHSKSFKKIKDLLPQRLVYKKSLQVENIYLLDENIAKNIVNKIGNDICNGAPVFECNPGFGLITKQLLRAGAKEIRIFETDQFFVKYAQMLESDHPEVRYFPSHFHQLWKISHLRSTNEESDLLGVMDGVKVKLWNDQPVVNFFCVLNSNVFLYSMIFNIVLQSGIVSYGRPEFYLLLSAGIYAKFMESRDKSYCVPGTFTVLCKTLFDLHFYGKFDRAAFIPWQNSSSVRNKNLCERFNLDLNKMYLIKLSPKKDLYETIPPDKLKMLWFFLKYHLRNKNNRVIPMMEQWVPGCGPRLILRGYDIFTEFSELSSDRLLELFVDFTQWPEFPSCSFKPAIQATSGKIITPTDLAISIDDFKTQHQQSISLSSE